MGRKRTHKLIKVENGSVKKYKVEGKEYNSWKEIHNHYDGQKVRFDRVINKSAKSKQNSKKSPKNASKYQKGDTVKIYGIDFEYNGERFINKKEKCSAWTER